MHKHVILAAVALTLAGCGATKITYTPMPGSPPPPAAKVALDVVDERPAGKGGSEKSQVGQIRGSYGIPSAVKDSTADVAPRTVAEATRDALGQAAVGVEPGGDRTLVATVKHYWMDGLVGYKATVQVQYALQDAAGKVLWTQEVTGTAGGTNLFKSGDSMTQDMFATALSELAKKAAEQFKSPAFRQALG